MKRLLTFALMLIPLLGMAQDDLYFTSSKKAKEEAKLREAEKRQLRTTISRVIQAQEDSILPSHRVAPIVDYQSNKRSDDEYNRRYVYGGQYVADSLAARIDSVYPEDYANYDVEDPEWDFRFSRRLVRFRNPRLYALASPYYWDLYYGYGAWDYLYDPFDPWHYHYGWSYGWTWGPWGCWYGGIWGYSRPYAWSYWGWGPNWSYPVYYTSRYHYNTVPRSYNSSRGGSMAAGSRIRTNAVGGRYVGTRTNAVASQNAAMSGRTAVPGSRVNPTTGRTNALEGRSSTQTRGTSYTDYTNVRTGGTSTTTAPRTQVYDRSTGTVQQGGGTTYQQPTRSYSNQNSSSRTNAVRQQQQQQQQQQPTRTTRQPEQQTQTRTRTNSVQQQTPTRSYTPTVPSTTTSSGSFGGGSSSGGGGSRGGGGGGGRR